MTNDPAENSVLTPTWKLLIRQQLHRAEMEYDSAVNAYRDAEGECRSSFYEHNQASYWKGRRDALRMFMHNSDVRCHSDDSTK